MADTVLDTLWEATHEGELPVVSDAASCTHGLAELGVTGEGAARLSRLQIMDATTFAA